MRILLVEDDRLLGDGIRTGLKHYGHTVDWLDNGRIALGVATSKHETFDVIVLDLGLPGMSGMEVLQQLRRKGIATPVLILTARENIEDRVEGLDSGADDYLTKPFDLDELCARLRALQRRTKARATSAITHGALVLDPSAHTVLDNGRPINLSRREFFLLKKLLENAGRVLSREQLNQAIYGWDDTVDSNTIEVHIHNLRKRLDSKLIRTVRGIGYMIDKT